MAWLWRTCKRHFASRFLLAALNHFLSDQWDRSRAAKRGHGQRPISLDADLAEQRYREEPSDGLTPQIAYERLWAATLLERAKTRMAEVAGEIHYLITVVSR
ncbi:MAG TPA: hypothetical protein PK640_00585 [Verrucomicrobiota bacterium]|nr:hypothetical protein [Verrucomicrobiota bacterium]